MSKYHRGLEPYVFVSHHSGDVEADQIIECLLRAGVRCWCDKDLTSGYYPEQIDERIEHCSCFLVVLSQNAVESKDIKKEIHEANSYERDIIVVHLGHVAYDRALRYELLMNHHITFEGDATALVNIILGDDKINRCLTHDASDLTHVLGLIGDGIDKKEVALRLLEDMLIRERNRYGSNLALGEGNTNIDVDLFARCENEPHQYGESYYGEHRDGLRHGLGALFRNNGYTYVGEWYKGDRDGRGIALYLNGDIYVGDWEKDYFQIPGRYYSAHDRRIFTLDDNMTFSDGIQCSIVDDADA